MEYELVCGKRDARTNALTIVLNAHFVWRRNRYWSVNEPKQMFLYISLAARYISEWLKKSLYASVNMHEMHTSTKQQHNGEQNSKKKTFIIHNDNNNSILLFPFWTHTTQKKLCDGVQALPSEKLTPHLFEIRTREGTVQKRRKTKRITKKTPSQFMRNASTIKAHDITNL